MIQEELQQFIEKWAEDKGLLKEENAPKQMLKLSEEVGELAGAYLKNKHEEIVDAIGDIQVVLIILSKQLGLDYNQCLEGAYNVIKNRTGKLVNGSFIKD
jgi:NTP pyrophosphatase (non-canonical NTP hydrolase)